MWMSGREAKNDVCKAITSKMREKWECIGEEFLSKILYGDVYHHRKFSHIHVTEKKIDVKLDMYRVINAASFTYNIFLLSLFSLLLLSHSCFVKTRFFFISRFIRPNFLLEVFHTFVTQTKFCAGVSSSDFKNRITLRMEQFVLVCVCECEQKIEYVYLLWITRVCIYNI